MRPKGVIYSSQGVNQHGEVLVSLPWFQRVIYHFIRGASASVIAFTILSLFFSLGPLIREELSYNFGETGTVDRVDREVRDFSVEVAEAEKAEYLDALRKGVAHAKGTYFPGQAGTIFLFSHSTDSPLNFARYNAVFYLLRKLEPGDTITIFFADKKFVYEVTQKRTADPDDTTWLTPKQTVEELILMTCDPPGTTWRRLLILAKPAVDNN